MKQAINDTLTTSQTALSDPAALKQALKAQALALGFQDLAITLPEAQAEQAYYEQWLARGYQGEMHYLENNLDKRFNPALLHPGTQRVIVVRMNYVPPDTETLRVLANPDKGYVARYTLGRDYHKLIRARLKQLGRWLQEHCETELNFRPFVDSAPVLERPLARNAGLGWIGKNTLLINRKAGSFFLLGELFIDLPLPVDNPTTEEHCGRCQACMDICPTQAIVEPGVLDARRCISYLTIELSGSIPEALRPKIGNRIFGCDDCQLICPWNRFAHHTEETDFQPRNQLHNSDLLELFAWDEATFLKRTEGSAIRRTGYEGWQRNIAVALGNGRGGEETLKALKERLETTSSEVIREHVLWAIKQLEQRHAVKEVPLFEDPRGRRIREDI